MLDKEAVVTVLRFYLMVFDLREVAAEIIVVGRGEKNVGCDGDNETPRLDSGKRRSDGTARTTDVVGVDSL